MTERKPAEPFIYRKDGKLSVKREITFRVHEALKVEDYRGDQFYPDKVVVTVFVDRANVQLTGRTSFSHSSTRSARFNLVSYVNYRPCPDWLKPLLREAGYTEEIEE